MTDTSFAVPLWAWLALTVVIVGMLTVDLFLHRDSQVIGFREALIWSGMCSSSRWSSRTSRCQRRTSTRFCSGV